MPLPIKIPQLVEFRKLGVRNKNKVLGVSAGSRDSTTGQIILWDNVDAHDQWIHFLDNGDTTFSLFFRHSAKVLAVPEGSKQKGVGLVQWDFHDGPEQKWYAEVHAGYFKLRNSNSDLYLAVEGNSSGNGAKFCQWDSLDEDGQFFYWEGSVKGQFD